jgi:hypothetical protein
VVARDISAYRESTAVLRENEDGELVRMPPPPDTASPSSIFET